MYYFPRGGNRGGADQFSWEGVKTDKDREYYLGHSLKASVGRWQDGRDLQWFNKERKGSASARSSSNDRLMGELESVKQAEKEAMMAALGQTIPPKTSTSMPLSVSSSPPSTKMKQKILPAKKLKRSHKEKRRKHEEESIKKVKKTSKKQKRRRSSSSETSQSSDAAEMPIKKHHHRSNDRKTVKEGSSRDLRRPSGETRSRHAHQSGRITTSRHAQRPDTDATRDYHKREKHHKHKKMSSERSSKRH